MCGPTTIAPIVDALAAVGASPARIEGAPFFSRQVRIVTENSGPSIRRASTTTSPPAATGRCATALTSMQPAAVREEIVKSGLRGRGGAGYPTGLKWNTVAKAAGTREVRHLQRGRGRPRGVHGPERPRERPAPGARRHGDRGLCRARDQGLRLLPRRVPARGQPAAQGDPRGDPGRLPRPDHPGHRVQLRGRRAPRRRRVRVRRGDRADRVGRGRRGTPRPRPPVSCGLGPVGPADAHQQRRDLRQRRADHPQRGRHGSPRSAPRRARAPRCSPSPAGSSTPGWSRSRWA